MNDYEQLIYDGAPSQEIADELGCQFTHGDLELLADAVALALAPRTD